MDPMIRWAIRMALVLVERVIGWPEWAMPGEPRLERP
jgi:hypothetical protein